MSASALAVDLNTKHGKPALVRFERVAQHLPSASEKEGRYIAVDVDLVTVQQLGSTDCVKFKVKDWLAQNERDLQNDRLPASHAAYYKEAYKRWLDGQEMPVTGTPIRGWAVISPAQQALLVNLGVRTVEDLSTMTDEGLTKIGIGAVTMKQKAVAWLAQANDKGTLTMEMVKIQQENADLKGTLESLLRQVQELKSAQTAQQASADPLSAAALLAEETEDTKKRGRRKEG